MKTRCDLCGRRFDRASFYDPCQMDHDNLPNKSDRLVEEIEREIHGRKGLGWRHLDNEIVDEIRDELLKIARKYIKD